MLIADYSFLINRTMLPATRAATTHCEQLDSLVDQCQHIVEGRDAHQLRSNQVLRQSVAQELSEVQSVLDDLLVDRPRRNILRRPK